MNADLEKEEREKDAVWNTNYANYTNELLLFVIRAKAGIHLATISYASIS